MRDKSVTARIKPTDRQQKDSINQSKWKKPTNIKPVRNNRISRKSGPR